MLTPWHIQFPNYIERMKEMRASCIVWLAMWDEFPETEPTLKD
jgi:hypothetical protein